MNYVLQLDTMDTTEEATNNNTTLLTQELSAALPNGPSMSKPLVASNNNKPQILQNLKAVSICSTISPMVKPVTVAYAANKTGRDIQRVPGSQTNTTQVLTTRVISQKLPSSTYQMHPTSLTLNTSHALHLPLKTPTPSAGSTVSKVQSSQSSTCPQNPNPQAKISTAAEAAQSKQQTAAFANMQTSVQQKLHQVSVQPILSNSVVKTMTTASSMPNIQRIQVKTQNLGGQTQTVNLHKVKTITGVNSPSAQRTAMPRIQNVPKSQVLASSMQATQMTMNQVMNSANMQRVQQVNSPSLQNLQKIQSGNIASAQKGVQVFNNQKMQPLMMSNVSGHIMQKVHQQQQPGNQQTLQKVQGVPQKALAAQRQQQPALMNNVQKPVNSVAGIQKTQVPVQQQHQQAQKQQMQSTQQQRPQTVATLQKSQALATVNPNKSQAITNVTKSSSGPNISKLHPNPNLLNVGKQQMVSQQQPTVSQQQQSVGQQHQINAQQPSQLQQQLLQTTPQLQQQQQTTQKPQQQASVPTQQQRNQTIVSMQQKMATITSVPNSQRVQSTTNAKVQQPPQPHMVLRVGPTKNQSQNMQPGNLKPVTQKVMNSVKPLNPQNTMQQPLHRNANAQPVKIIQQQQNVIGPQNAQKQPGCIKTIPAQKPAQRNHAQKMTGIKTSLNTNMSALKGQGPQATITQKTTIKTLLPQQPSGPSMLVHKNQPVKIQQQTIQQKQLVVASQYPQQARPPAGQIKTLLPVASAEPRRDEVKIEIESHPPKEEEHQQAQQSPVRRMPLPYECLQFVLQDHNYGAPPPRTPPPASPPPHPKQQPINGAGSSAVVSQHPYTYGQAVSSTNIEDDAGSAISSGREAEPEGEETETAPEGEGDDEDSVTRCICDFEHDDGYMICCDRCLVWQHVDCMGIDRSNIPDEYLCEICRPRRVDRQRARALQLRKREELLNSDTSSDSSSTSSADTDVGVSTTQKKRAPQQAAPRRKSDPPPQVRRLSSNNNNNNNNNVAKRQRREPHPRQTSAVRKKETAKRGPGKRKTKRRMSLDDREEETQDAWGTNMAPLRQWIERYEEAVTNHYSPELRARISSIKVNGAHGDLRQSNLNAAAIGKCRLNIHSNNLRFLVATMYLPPNSPVVELRGKYMLSTQHRPSHPQGRQHAQRPGPFVFFYRLPRDGTEVCVDTRTYGNDARFVRRSCKPNAEVKHCIEKGTLHLYIVTTTAIEKNAEITIRHEQHDLMLSPNSSSPLIPLVCACNNARECQIAAMGQLSRRGSNGALAENADGRERRRRARRSTVCEDSDSLSAVSSTSVTQPTPTPVQTPAVAPPRRTVTSTSTSTSASATTSATVSATATTSTSATATVTTTASSSTPVTRQATKEEPPPIQQPQTSPVVTQPHPQPQETKKDKKKMTREERKMEAIMKAFERLEKAEQRKQEVQARNAQRKESGGAHSDDDNHSTTSQMKPKQQNSERPMRRKRRKGRARTTSSSQSNPSSRRMRLNSADSDISSGEESTSMQSPPLPNQNCPPNRRIPYAPHLHTPTKDNDITETSSPGHQGIPTAAGLLLALANSNIPGPSSPPLQQPTPVKSPTCDSGASSSSQSSTPSTPLSSACLLVAAAVGPLAPGFKFPKTKKVLMNEWLKESPDPPQSHIPQLPPLPPTQLPNPTNQLNRPMDFLSPSDPSPEFLTQSYAAKSLATLVQAANSVSGICDSPPQRRQTIPGNMCSGSTGSAKKRWLRQAISEECDSPNSRPESPPSEMVAPPKKRRIARESLSSDNYTPPTTPTMLVPEPLVVPKPIGQNEDEFVEPLQSLVREQTMLHQEYATAPIKEEVDSEPEPMELEGEKAKSDFPEPKFEIPQHTPQIKTEDEDEPMALIKADPFLQWKKEFVPPKEETSVKTLTADVKMEQCPVKTEIKESVIKKEPDPPIKTEVPPVKSEVLKKEKEALPVKEETIPVKKETHSVIIEKGTVEIIDQNEPDTEMEDLSSPIAAMESDAVLKQRVAEMRLEFGGGIAEIVNIASENEKSDDDRKSDNKCDAPKSDDNVSIDEFDVEAQMMKITGDDGNDYKEKVDTSSEKDKSMDGIEGLMESSKEDSESEDREVDDMQEEGSSFSEFHITSEQRAFREFGIKHERKGFIELEVKEVVDYRETETLKPESIGTPIIFSEDSILESTSSNIDIESLTNTPKMEFPIPPLSERIRKKPDLAQPAKTQLDFETAIIESTIEVETGESSTVGEEKSMLSSALRELLEAKIDVDQPVPETVGTASEEVEITLQAEKLEVPCTDSSKVEDTMLETNEALVQVEDGMVKADENSAKEPKRLKDPRTVTPSDMPAPPVLKPEVPAPAKRKLSISEYRKRKQQSSGGTPPEPEPSTDASSDRGAARGRSDSASSGTSSLSSDEEGSSKVSLDLPGLTTLPLFINSENEEKKGGEDGVMGWSAAPTLVERQRENLTERLKREFGLFLSDDEEERARKQGLTAEAILKARKTSSPPHSSISTLPPIFPSAQLPPQPYIPPPGSAPIHYSQFQTKPIVQYPNFPMPQIISQPIFPNVPLQPVSGKQAQQFLMPQAPPGSNPYPPPFVPSTSTAVPIPRFPPALPPPPPPPPPPGAQFFPPPPQPQKPFFNHPASRS